MKSIQFLSLIILIITQSVWAGKTDEPDQMQELAESKTQFTTDIQEEKSQSLQEVNPTNDS